MVNSPSNGAFPEFSARMILNKCVGTLTCPFPITYIITLYVAGELLIKTQLFITWYCTYLFPSFFSSGRNRGPLITRTSSYSLARFLQYISSLFQ